MSTFEHMFSTSKAHFFCLANWDSILIFSWDFCSLWIVLQSCLKCNCCLYEGKSKFQIRLISIYWRENIKKIVCIDIASDARMKEGIQLSLKLFRKYRNYTWEDRSASVGWRSLWPIRIATRWADRWGLLPALYIVTSTMPVHTQITKDLNISICSLLMSKPSQYYYNKTGTVTTSTNIRKFSRTHLLISHHDMWLRA